jgi:phosphosulfolactate synthase (CoM biosynthesis protein A)
LLSDVSLSSLVQECKDLGFDAIEVNTDLICLQEEDLLRLIRTIKSAGLKARPELGIKSAEDESEGVNWVIRRAERFLEAGADAVLIDSDGITENVGNWRTDVIAKVIERLGLEKIMFEAADPRVFEWFIQNYGSKVNLFVDHSHLLQLEGLRSGVRGGRSVWGHFLL